MAPEIFTRNYDGFKSDVWSFGLVLYQLVTGNFPSPNVKLPPQLQKDPSTKIISNIISRCLQPQETRASILNLIELLEDWKSPFSTQIFSFNPSTNRRVVSYSIPTNFLKVSNVNEINFSYLQAFQINEELNLNDLPFLQKIKLIPNFFSLPILFGNTPNSNLLNNLRSVHILNCVNLVELELQALKLEYLCCDGCIKLQKLLLKTPSLQVLIFKQCDQIEISTLYSLLNKCTALQTLTLENCKRISNSRFYEQFPMVFLLQSSNFFALQPIFIPLYNQEPKKLKLKGLTLGQLEMQLLHKILQLNTSLTHLIIEDNHLTDESWKIFCNEMCKNNQIASLDLLYIPFSSDLSSTAFLSSLQNLIETNITLQSLSLFRNNINDQQMVNLCNSMERNYTLNLFALLDNPLTDIGLTLYFQLFIKKQNLIRCKLQWIKLGLSSISTLAKSIQENHLDSVYLGNVNLSDMHLRELKDPLASTMVLTSLELPNNKLGNSTCLIIKEVLLRNKSITKLSLKNNSIGPLGATNLSEALMSNTTLKEMYLGGNLVSTEGAEKLSSIFSQNASLEVLDLSFNQIGESALISFQQHLKNNTSLKKLNLENNYCNLKKLNPSTKLKSVVEMIH